MSLISIIFKSVLGEGCFILNLFLRLRVCGSAKAWLLLQVLKCPFWSYWCHWFHAWSMQNWCCMVFSTGCWEHRPVCLLVQLHWQLSRPPSTPVLQMQTCQPGGCWCRSQIGVFWYPWHVRGLPPTIWPPPWVPDPASSALSLGSRWHHVALTVLQLWGDLGHNKTGGNIRGKATLEEILRGFLMFHFVLCIGLPSAFLKETWLWSAFE